MAIDTDDYIANTDIETGVGSLAYVQLADDDGDGSADAAVVDEIRLAATGEVNSFLARRYAVPIATTSEPALAELLKSVTLDLAEHRLRSRRPPVPAESTQRRDATIHWLRDVAEGRIDLPSVAPVTTHHTRGASAAIAGEERTMSRESMEQY